MQRHYVSPQPYLISRLMKEAANVKFANEVLYVLLNESLLEAQIVFFARVDIRSSDRIGNGAALYSEMGYFLKREGHVLYIRLSGKIFGFPQN